MENYFQRSLKPLEIKKSLNKLLISSTGNIKLLIEVGKITQLTSILIFAWFISIDLDVKYLMKICIGIRKIKVFKTLTY